MATPDSNTVLENTGKKVFRRYGSFDRDVCLVPVPKVDNEFSLRINI